MRNILCGAAIILSGLCGNAQAVPVSASLLGTINSGPNSIDTAGFFGPAGASLAGDAIDIVFNYNSSSFMQVGNGVFISQSGLSVGAMVNGRLLSFQTNDPTSAGQIAIGSTKTTLDTGAGSAGLSESFLSLATDPTSTLTSIIALTGLASSSDTISLYGGRNRPSDTLAFTLTPAIAVPEPGSLALFATGLLGVGIVAWRRRNRSDATPIG